MPHPVLYIFSGLPGGGKTTLARHLARELSALHLRIDTIEQALRETHGRPLDGPEGYLIAYRLAEDNLLLGMSVVADSVNPIHLTRAAWRDVAMRTRVPYVEIEVRCSDAVEHRARVEWRASDIPSLRLPTWDDVQSREYEPWDADRVIVIDTAGQTMSQSIESLNRALAAKR